MAPSILKGSILLLAVLVLVFFKLGGKAADGDSSLFAPLPMNYPEVQQKYPFLELDKNQITYPADKGRLAHFYQRLDTLLFEGEGQVRILHMGGSHVQGGAIGFRMRELFDHLSFDLCRQRGLIFPFRVASTNSSIYTRSEATGNWDGLRCAHNKHQSDWGLSGMTITTTSDSATFKVWATDRDSSIYQGTRVRLYVKKDSLQFNPIWNGVLSPDSIIDTPLSSFIEYQFAESVDTLAWTFISSDSTQVQAEVYGVHLSSGEPGLIFEEVGVNGASTKSYLRCDRMEEELSTLPPDLVIFGIGINDAYMTQGRFQPKEFKARYDSLIQIVRRVNPRADILMLTNNDSYYRKRYANPNVDKVQRVMYELAEEHSLAVWDLYEIMGGFNSIRNWERSGLAKRDKIHFTREGYYLQAELMYSALMEDYGNYLNVGSTDPENTTTKGRP